MISICVPMFNDEVHKWCHENVLPALWSYNGFGIYVFQRKEDALAFKLKFGGV